MNTYWAYLHITGSIKLKRYRPDGFAEEMLGDARRSPFVVRVFGPFEAESNEEAEEKAKQGLEAERK